VQFALHRVREGCDDGVNGVEVILQRVNVFVLTSLGGSNGQVEIDMRVDAAQEMLDDGDVVATCLFEGDFP